MHEWLLNLSQHHHYTVYFVVLSIAFFEGPIIALATGFLTYMGYLNMEISVVILVLGNVIPDTVLYYTGRLGHGREFVNKHLLKSEFLHKNIKFIERMWEHHPWKTMFFGKMAYAISAPFLVSLGLIKTPLRKYLYYSTIINIFLASTVFFIGYNLSYSYEKAAGYIQYVGVLFTALIILFIFLYNLMTKYFMKKFEEEEREEVNSTS